MVVLRCMVEFCHDMRDAWHETCMIGKGMISKGVVSKTVALIIIFMVMSVLSLLMTTIILEIMEWI